MPPMRRPSTFGQLYAWWQAAMRGERPDVVEGEPECGWFMTRLVKGGPWVPARVFVERELDERGELAGPEEYVAEVDGVRRDAARVWVSICRRVISREDYDALMARRSADPRLLATLAQYDITEVAPRP